jgi:hypothetical protein
MVVEIPLTQGYVALVDDEDAERVLAMGKWYPLKKGRGVNARVCAWRQPYDPSAKRRKTIYMHRVILDAPVGMDVDHINHNELDNRRANLRVCNRSENMRNLRKPEGGTSRYKGVHFEAQTRRWKAQIRSPEGKQTNLGRFDAEEEAARVYDAAARKYFGEFAALNFPVAGEGGC